MIRLPSVLLIREILIIHGLFGFLCAASCLDPIDICYLI